MDIFKDKNDNLIPDELEENLSEVKANAESIVTKVKNFFVKFRTFILVALLFALTWAFIGYVYTGLPKNNKVEQIIIDEKSINEKISKQYPPKINENSNNLKTFLSSLEVSKKETQILQDEKGKEIGKRFKVWFKKTGNDKTKDPSYFVTIFEPLDKLDLLKDYYSVSNPTK